MALSDLSAKNCLVFSISGPVYTKKSPPKKHCGNLIVAAETFYERLTPQLSPNIPTTYQHSNHAVDVTGGLTCGVVTSNL